MLVFLLVCALFLIAAALRIVEPPAALPAAQWLWLQVLTLVIVHLGTAIVSLNARYISFTDDLFWIIAGGLLPLLYTIHWPLYAGLSLPGDQAVAEVTAALVIFLPAVLFYAGPLRAAMQPRQASRGNADSGSLYWDFPATILLLLVGLFFLSLTLSRINDWYAVWGGYIAVLSLGDHCAADLTLPDCQQGFRLWQLAPWTLSAGQFIGVLLIALPNVSRWLPGNRK